MVTDVTKIRGVDHLGNDRTNRFIIGGPGGGPRSEFCFVILGFDDVVDPNCFEVRADYKLPVQVVRVQPRSFQYWKSPAGDLLGGCEGSVRAN
ncbi:hypothetical protein PGTUg99_000627 [Puccinia graminis f. sp. tritici]|uniref:Uncharacterized protein n=1 Tax=Puccinia graminis f. sp. tritici TaxID=56615 RepID=A0A5B0M462_PUCGR|nr:hypothetical protein PGTUg99_000627 [Puccinia graminis f. sp. tritici]